jgi:hypothetical protein
MTLPARFLRSSRLRSSAAGGQWAGRGAGAVLEGGTGGNNETPWYQGVSDARPKRFELLTF